VKLPAHGTFLKNAPSFDNISLGISTRDARVIPYSGRRLLDLSFQALLDSGIDSRGHNIGCFMSANRPLQGEARDLFNVISLFYRETFFPLEPNRPGWKYLKLDAAFDGESDFLRAGPHWPFHLPGHGVQLVFDGPSSSYRRDRTRRLCCCTCWSSPDKSRVRPHGDRNPERR
jgi:hypothetical protein